MADGCYTRKRLSGVTLESLARMARIFERSRSEEMLLLLENSIKTYRHEQLERLANAKRPTTSEPAELTMQGE